MYSLVYLERHTFIDLVCSIKRGILYRFSLDYLERHTFIDLVCSTWKDKLLKIYSVLPGEAYVLSLVWSI